MKKYLYSESRDRNKNPKKPSSKKKASRKAAPPPDPGNVKPLAPSNEERIKIRRAQMDADLEGYQRRRYETQEGTNFSEPHHLPPRYDLRKPHAIEDWDLDSDVEDDPDLSQNPSTRIAEISLRDESLTKVDNLISDCFQNIRSLKSALQEVQDKAQQDDNQEMSYHAEQAVWICEEALEPWMREIDGHLDGLIEQTPEEKTGEREI